MFQIGYIHFFINNTDRWGSLFFPKFPTICKNCGFQVNLSNQTTCIFLTQAGSYNRKIQRYFLFKCLVKSRDIKRMQVSSGSLMRSSMWIKVKSCLKHIQESFLYSYLIYRFEFIIFWKWIFKNIQILNLKTSFENFCISDLFCKLQTSRTPQSLRSAGAWFAGPDASSVAWIPPEVSRKRKRKPSRRSQASAKTRWPVLCNPCCWSCWWHFLRDLWLFFPSQTAPSPGDMNLSRRI